MQCGARLDAKRQPQQRNRLLELVVLRRSAGWGEQHRVVRPRSSTGSFSFEPSTAVYTVNWTTGAAPAGCYSVVVTLSDQSVYATMVTLAAQGGATTLLQYNFDNVPQGAGSQTAPASFAAPNLAGATFTLSNVTNSGMTATGCAEVDCVDSTSVITNSAYTWSITNNGTGSASLTSLSFHESNDDCSGGGACSGQTFAIQADSDPNFGTANNTLDNYTPPTSAADDHTISPSLTLSAGATMYLRIVATGSSGSAAAHYRFDNVTVKGSH